MKDIFWKILLSGIILVVLSIIGLTIYDTVVPGPETKHFVSRAMMIVVFGGFGAVVLMLAYKALVGILSWSMWMLSGNTNPQPQGSVTDPA